jgi:hypothetical protein
MSEPSEPEYLTVTYLPARRSRSRTPGDLPDEAEVTVAKSRTGDKRDGHPAQLHQDELEARERMKEAIARYGWRREPLP